MEIVRTGDQGCNVEVRKYGGITSDSYQNNNSSWNTYDYWKPKKSTKTIDDD